MRHDEDEPDHGRATLPFGELVRHQPECRAEEQHFHAGQDHGDDREQSLAEKGAKRDQAERDPADVQTVDRDDQRNKKDDEAGDRKASRCLLVHFECPL